MDIMIISLVALMVLGGFVGIIVPGLPGAGLMFLGMLLGLFGGAVAGEMLYAKKDLNTSLQAGTGAIIGFLAGTVIKVLIGVIMIGLFLWRIVASQPWWEFWGPSWQRISVV